MNAVLISTLVTLSVSVIAAEPAPRFSAVEEQLMERATRIPIPRVEFKDVTFADALEFLRGEARTHDSKHQGIPIEMHADPWPKMEFLPQSKTPKPTPPGGWPLDEPLKQRITLSLRDTSLAEALRYVTALLNYQVIPSRTALMIARVPESTDTMLTHTISLAAAPKAEVERMRASPEQYFTDAGAYFHGSAACVFEDGGVTLVVTNTLEQLDLIHAILESLVPHRPLKKSK